MDPLTQAITDVRAELARVDGKGFALLALAGTALSAGLAVVGTGQLHGPARTAAVVAGLLILASVAALADAIRPRLTGRYGFMAWAAAGTLDEVLAHFAAGGTERQAHELRALSRSVRGKYRRIQLGLALLGGGLVAAIVTAYLHSQS
ncbi:Pycsar system effector family protein [Micromonospora sp. WMMD734]|uniref:Pycsar system effector family protein n=1 Tax=Micromonospora sp. WMMD734 TaxID=3404129 RepID=UPI003B9247B1